jgi:hypothetical protein
MVRGDYEVELTRFDGHLINPVRFTTEVFNDEIEDWEGEAGSAFVQR